MVRFNICRVRRMFACLGTLVCAISFIIIICCGSICGMREALPVDWLVSFARVMWFEEGEREGLKGGVSLCCFVDSGGA